MTAGRTTRCCSVGLIVTLLAGVLVEPAAADRTPRRSTPFPMEPFWSATLPAPVAAWPATDGDRLYLALRDGQLMALSLADGRALWSTDLPTALTPAAGGELVYVGSGETLYALHADNGQVAWGAPMPAAVSAPPLWDTGWLLIGLESGEVHAFRAEDGRPIWRRMLAAPMRVAASIAAERAYLPLEDGRVVSVDLRTGEPKWERRLGGRPDRILALDDRLFVGATDNFLYCLSLGDGSVNWRWPTGGDVIGEPVVDERHVYFASLDNVLRALDRRSGNQRWRRPLPVRPSAGPRLAAGVVFAASRSPEVRVYFTADGEAAGVLTVTAELGAPPIIVERPEPAGRLLLLVTTERSGEGRVETLRRAIGPPLVPLDYLPVKTVPFDVLPGTTLPPEPPPREDLLLIH